LICGVLKLITTYRLQRCFGAGKIAGINIATFYYYNLPATGKNMKQDKLTESAIKKAKPGAKQFKLSDGGGLYLLVHSNGSKYWRFDFRFEGKQKSSSLGVWPEVSLTEARSRRNEAKMKIREGINPIQEKKKKSAQQHEQVWKKENSAERSGPELQQVVQKPAQKQTPQSTGKPTRDAVNLLKSNIYPELGEKPVSEINKQDMTAILKNVYGSRKEVIQIIWNIYPNYPVVQLAVLFILLFVTIDFLPALVTTSLYFIITVCVTVGRDLWIENKQQY
jgi:hypothetical protein